MTQFQAEYDPFQLPEPVKEINDLYRNIIALMVNNLRSGIYISHFLKRLLRSRTPCDVIQKLRDITCAGGNILGEVHNFIPLEEFSDILSTIKVLDKSDTLNLNKDLVNLIPTAVQKNLVGGNYRKVYKFNHKIDIKLHNKFKKLVNLYNKLIKPIHDKIQEGGGKYDHTVAVLENLLTNFDYERSRKFMDWRPKLNNKKLGTAVWYEITDLNKGILKKEKLKLRSLVSIIEKGKAPDKKPITKGKVEWNEWVKYSKQFTTGTDAKNEFVKIVKSGIQKVYKKYKKLYDEQVAFSQKELDNKRELEKSCADVLTKIPEDATVVQKEQACHTINGCVWQLFEDKDGNPYNDCKPGSDRLLLRSIMPEGIKADCGIVDGPCQLFKAMAHFICPYNKFNIELVEKFESFFSDQNINGFLKMLYELAENILGNSSPITLAISQIRKDIWRINLEMKQVIESGEEISYEGGGNIYKYIKNPKTNRLVRTNTKLGQSIINKYKIISK